MRFLAKVSVAIALCGNAFVGGAQAAPAADVDVPAPLGDLAVTLPLLVDRLHAGELTVHKAWEAGELSLGDALYLLGHASDWGAIEGRDNVPLRHALVRLILEQDKGRLEKLKQTPAKARLWIGEYLQVQGDERAVQVLESVLSEFKEPVKEYEQTALLFLSVERLAWFYEARGESVKAAQTWERLPPLMSEANWMVPDALIGAARAYAADGQEDKARGLYAQVPQYGQGWFSGVALFDQAQQLIAQGKYDQAQQLLRQPIQGPGGEAMRVANLALLAYTNYIAGDLEVARAQAQQVVAAYQESKDTVGWSKIAAQVNLARSLQSWIDRWGQNPIIAAPSHLSVRLSKDEMREGVAVRRIKIRVPQKMALVASSRDGALQISLSSEWRTPSSGALSLLQNPYWEKEVTVTIALDQVAPKMLYAFRIGSSPLPVAQVDVPVHIQNAQDLK